MLRPGRARSSSRRRPTCSCGASTTCGPPTGAGTGSTSSASAFEEAGLVVDRLSYYYSFLVPPAALVRKTPLKRVVKETDEETSTMHPAIDTIFYRLAKIERLLSRRGATIPFGLSMFCVAHKPAEAIGARP